MQLEMIIKNRKHPRDIIIVPLFTEKSGTQIEKQKSYSFKVDIKANKIEIKHAIESIFSVLVKDVNTMRIKGKVKRMGRYSGRRPGWKKAVITLKESYSIPGFDI